MIPDELREFQSVIRRWVAADVTPHAAAVDADGRFPDEAWTSYVKNGWVGLPFPSDLGGEGADQLACAVFVEEVARGCASSSLMALISKLAMTPVLGFGSKALQERYVPPIARGEVQASYCLSEPGAGSDVASMTTVARRDGEDYVIDGTKCWVTNAGVSDVYTVFAKTDPSAGARDISCFVAERSFGIDFGKFEKKLGMRGSPTGEVRFDGVRVPAANRVGEEGQGFEIAMWTLDRSRPMIGAQAVGIGAGALEAASGYLHERAQFGVPLADFQGLRFMVADMAMKLEAARQLVHEAVRTIDAGDPRHELNALGAMAKCFASDVAMEVTTNAVQLLGGYGYTADFPLERAMRDAKLTQIYEGTNQIQRLVIARHVLGRESPKA